MKLTLDTNCLINHFDTQSATATSREEVGQLIRYATSGQVEIVITTRAEADLDQDKDDKRRERLKRNLAMFEVIGSVLRGALWANTETRVLADEVQKLLFPGLSEDDKRRSNKIRDVDHLTAHTMAGRDIFVTDDRHLIKRADELKKLGAVVMTPAECVAYIEAIDANAKPKSLNTSSSTAYHSKGLSNVVIFDYSNNDGRFAIGEGHFLFETAWSKASDISIYALRDPPSIEGVALVKELDRIESITDAAKYDYSSRYRTPKIGQIVLWRNTNGLYAATKILEIADDSRGAKHDELSFEYRVLTQGTSFA